MKIDDPIKKIAGPNHGQAAVRAEKSNNSNSIRDNSSDTVHLSALSSQLLALEEKSPTSNVFNAKKVEEIKLAIANGNFKINADKVADGILDTVKGLLHTPSKE